MLLRNSKKITLGENSEPEDLHLNISDLIQMLPERHVESFEYKFSEG